MVRTSDSSVLLVVGSIPICELRYFSRSSLHTIIHSIIENAFIRIILYFLCEVSCLKGPGQYLNRPFLAISLPRNATPSGERVRGQLSTRARDKPTRCDPQNKNSRRKVESVGGYQSSPPLCRKLHELNFQCWKIVFEYI